DDSILRVEKTLFAGVSRGDCALTLNQHDRQSYRATVGIEVDDVDSLHRDYAARGVAILPPPPPRGAGRRGPARAAGRAVGRASHGGRGPGRERAALLVAEVTVLRAITRRAAGAPRSDRDGSGPASPTRSPLPSTPPRSRRSRRAAPWSGSSDRRSPGTCRPPGAGRSSPRRSAARRSSRRSDRRAPAGKPRGSGRPD